MIAYVYLSERFNRTILHLEGVDAYDTSTPGFEML
jgi:hypothetical protein